MNCLLGEAWNRQGIILNFSNEAGMAAYHGFPRLSFITLMYPQLQLLNVLYCTGYFTKENSLIQEMPQNYLIIRKVFFLCSGHWAYCDEKVSRVLQESVQTAADKYTPQREEPGFAFCLGLIMLCVYVAIWRSATDEKIKTSSLLVPTSSARRERTRATQDILQQPTGRVPFQ